MNTQNLARYLPYIASALVLGVVIAGFMLVGSPSFNRKLAVDLNCLEDLKSIHSDIGYYFRDNKKLPINLIELGNKNDFDNDGSLDEAFTNPKYKYRVLSETNYELCSDFKLTSDDAKLEKRMFEGENKKWKHGVGYHCFKLEIPKSFLKNLNVEVR